MGKCPFNKDIITHLEENELGKDEIILARKEKKNQWTRIRWICLNTSVLKGTYLLNLSLVTFGR